ncbi:hypothetical protein [Variovorax gossypii]
MRCYFQGCDEEGVTKEHIPPRSFFPQGENVQLLTVKSCKKHNNEKSKNDIYALAQICMNAAPSNRAREVFENKIFSQLDHNNGAFRKLLAAGSEVLPDGAVRYPVDIQRLDDFFTALSCGIIFKSCGASLPPHFNITHAYHSLEYADPQLKKINEHLERFYSGSPPEVMEFGKVDAQNKRIYTIKIFGIKSFKSSITLVHEFYGTFKVTSMLTNVIGRSQEITRILEGLSDVE